ncbi:type I-E CRISPR-associated protein Cse1/CasA [Streptomyces sp. NPDC093085]|uniref:type I-E CRISPR-associated protein Cse1/CasA n=1 Tax=Streptomyces sp. NPDC093085 TaxID=3155068 RepID=UPI003437E9AC
MPEARAPVPAQRGPSSEQRFRWTPRSTEELHWDPRYQPCIPAVAWDGSTAHHSLHALFTQAERLVSINCATPGETVAVIEFLMAICFAAEACPSSDEEWRTWIADPHALDGAPGWLDDQPDDAWDLFGSEHPLGQNLGLEPEMGRSGTGTAQLVLEQVGDYHQHFDHHHLDRGDPLPAAEAFRAMLTQHVYAPYGRARISGEKLGATVTNLAAGRLTGRIRVVALGATLGETLRLNLYPPEGPGDCLNTSWTTPGSAERRTFNKKATPRVPRSSADLHSALGRSILLRGRRGPDGDALVDRVLIGAGEVLELDLRRHLQDAVPSRTMNGQEKPLWPSPTRALWQDAHALYAAVVNRENGLFTRLGSLAKRGVGAPYHMWAVGLLTNQALPMAWTQGAYPYAPGMERHLYHASFRGSKIAEYIAGSLKSAAVLAMETAHPAAHAADKNHLLARFDARWLFWPDAAQPFYRLLDTVIREGKVDDDDPVSAPLIEYATILVTSARNHLTHRLDSLPPNSRSHHARARAENRFEDEMARAKAPAEIRGEIAHD